MAGNFAPLPPRLHPFNNDVFLGNREAKSYPPLARWLGGRGVLVLPQFRLTCRQEWSVLLL